MRNTSSRGCIRLTDSDVAKGSDALNLGAEARERLDNLQVRVRKSEAYKLPLFRLYLNPPVYNEKEASKLRDKIMKTDDIEEMMRILRDNHLLQNYAGRRRERKTLRTFQLSIASAVCAGAAEALEERLDLKDKTLSKAFEDEAKSLLKYSSSQEGPEKLVELINSMKIVAEALVKKRDLVSAAVKRWIEENKRQPVVGMRISNVKINGIMKDIPSFFASHLQELEDLLKRAGLRPRGLKSWILTCSMWGTFTSETSKSDPEEALEEFLDKVKATAKSSIEKSLLRGHFSCHDA